MSISVSLVALYTKLRQVRCLTHIGREGALASGGLGSKSGGIRLAEWVLRVVISGMTEGVPSSGAQNHGILARSGSYGVLAKTS